MAQGQATNSVGGLLAWVEDLRIFWKGKKVMEPYKQRKEIPHDARDCMTPLDGSIAQGKSEKEYQSTKLGNLSVFRGHIKVYPCVIL